MDDATGLDYARGRGAPSTEMSFLDDRFVRLVGDDEHGMGNLELSHGSTPRSNIRRPMTIAPVSSKIFSSNALCNSSETFGPGAG